MEATDPAPTKVSRWSRFWADYFAKPQDPHEPIKQDKRDEVSQAATDEQFNKATEIHQAAYDNRGVSFGQAQQVNAFIFNGIAALFVMIAAGIITAIAFTEWMGLLLLPSLYLAGGSVTCFLTGHEPAKDQVHPKHTGDEYVVVLEKVLAGEGAQQKCEQTARRSIKQRFRFWVSNAWAKRGFRMMKACIVTLMIELTAIAVLVVVL